MPTQIMFTDADAQSAQTIQADIASANLRLDHDLVIVVLSPEAVQDDALKQDVQTARQLSDATIIPIIISKTSVPDYLRGVDTLDLSKKYDKTKLVNFVKRVDLTADSRLSNRTLLYLVGGGALVMFLISVVSISAGVVAFPVDEYATENAIRDSQLSTIVAPQIEELRPRTTEDALNFATTLEAVRNEDLIPFIEGTATAIPEQFFATSEARQTQIFQTQTADD